MRPKVILPNMFTAFSLSSGLFVIFRMNMLEPGAMTYTMLVACICILLFAVFLDFIDGAIARIIHAETEFGGVFDSMADAVSFGVAPAALVLKALSLAAGTLPSFFLAMGAMVYSISGVLRLVRFTVTAHEIQGDKEQMALAKTHFTGLPITAAAACLISTVLLLSSESFRAHFSLSEESAAWISIAAFFILGFFMVSSWKFPSMKCLRFKVGSFLVVAGIAAMAALVFAGALNYFPFVFAAISWGYFFISLILSCIRFITGKRLQSLEDFDFSDED
jgi:CDP-diacylglycerol--serine O-phosphatidyltransferase